MLHRKHNPSARLLQRVDFNAFGGTGFSLCAFSIHQKKSKPHRLKSLCENYNSKAPAAEAAPIFQTLRHG